MRIAFVHDWPVDYEQEYTWRDGLCAAIKILSSRHELRFFVSGDRNMVIPHPYFKMYVSNDIPTDVEAFRPDKIVMWGDCTRPNAERCAALGKPMALCFAGGNPEGYTNKFFDHFFVESQVYKDKFEAMGRSVSTAFGTNTELFNILPRQKYMFDALFPATFCTWKRHDLFAAATKGLTACAVGLMYPEQENFCYHVCQEAGVLTLPHVSAEALKHLYAASRVVVIPSRADGGSQRTVLEAMAMNVPVVVCSDSDKTTEYVRQGGGYIAEPNAASIREAIEKASNENLAPTRRYILDNWSELQYANAIDVWIKS